MKEVASRRVSKVMRRSPLILYPSDTVSKFLGRLYGSDFEAVVVDRATLGLVTLRDALNVRHPERTRVDGIAANVAAIGTGSTILEAVDIMNSNKIRAVPVAEDGDIVGLVSQVEVVNSLAESQDLKEVKSKDIMKSPVISIGQRENISKARNLMLRYGISHLPILDGHQRLRGIITAKAIVHTLVKPEESTKPGERVGESFRVWDAPVKILMDDQLLMAGEGSSALGIVRDFNRFRKYACMVMDQGRILGIITPMEIIRLLLKFKVEKRLPIYIMGLPESRDLLDVAISEDKIARVVRRSLKYSPDIEEVIVHVKEKRRAGNRTLYHVRARVYTPTEYLVAFSEGWYLAEAFDSLCEKLDVRLRKGKRDPMSLRTGGGQLRFH